MSTDDQDLIPSIPLPADEVTAHIAVLVGAANTINRNVRDLRNESRDRDMRTSKRLESIETRISTLEGRPILTTEQHDLVVRLERKEEKDTETAQHVSRTRRGDLPIYIATSATTLITIVGFILKLTGHL